MNFFLQKSIYALLVLFLCTSCFFVDTNKVYAVGWPVWDPINGIFNAHSAVSNSITAPASAVSAGANTTNTAIQGSFFAKTFVGDALATAIAKQMIRQLTAQTVNWINTGFKGNPAYVTNPEQFFLNIGDSAAAQILSSNAFTNSLCSPFSAQVRLALTKNYLNTTNPNYSCTLGKLTQNFDNFANNFSSGGWDAWFQVTQNQTNNPYGAYLGGVDSITAKIGTQQNHYQTQLSQGGGFLSWETCSDSSAGSTNPTTNGSTRTVCLKYGPVTGASGAVDANGLPISGTSLQCIQSDIQVYQNGQWVSQGSVMKNIDSSTNTQLQNCPNGQTQVNTPGSVIAAQLNKSVASPVAQLELTNSINQVVGALMTQLVQQVVGGIGNGLRGLSQPGSAPSGYSSSSSFLQQMIATPSDVSTTSPGYAPTAADLEDASTTAGIMSTASSSSPKPIDNGIPASTTVNAEIQQEASSAGSTSGSAVPPSQLISCNGQSYPNDCGSESTFTCEPLGFSGQSPCCSLGTGDITCPPVQ